MAERPKSVPKGTKIETHALTYIVEKFVGRGSFANVYRCLQNTPATTSDAARRVTLFDKDKRKKGKQGGSSAAQSNVAIKMYCADPKYIRYFRNEFRINSHLSQYKSTDIYSRYVCLHIDAFCRTFTHLNNIYMNPCLVFPLLGDRLYDMLVHLESGLPYPSTNNVLKQIACGLAFMHTHGVIHTDIKPENIMMKKRIADVNPEELFDICIIDLGSSMMRNRITSYNVGTFAFNAPEILLEIGFDTPVDIWSYGCLAFELITGDPLFDVSMDDDSRQSENNSNQMNDDAALEYAASSSNSSANSDASDEDILGGVDDSEDEAELIASELGNETAVHPTMFTEDRQSTSSSDHDTWYKRRQMLIEMRNLLGDMPIEIAKKNTKYFNSRGYLRHESRAVTPDLKKYLRTNYTFDDNEAEKVAAYLQAILNYDPKKRPTAQMLINMAI